MAGKLLMLDRALEPLLTPLLALLDVPVEDAAWAALDPPQRRQRTLDAIRRLLLRESLVQPLLLLFEDLHWIDAETQALLDGLMESLPTARILLLVNYRPEYQHAWGGKTYYVQLRIDPLPPESADTLLTALLGEDQTLAPLKRVLIERTEGNPFFLEESVRTLVETQVLVGERGAYRVAKAPDAWQIPVTVQAILAARIDRLAPEDKRLLQAAAVIGKDVPFTLLQAIADVPEDTLRRGLTHLQAAEFLYETSLFPDLEYTFKHALTHEVAYGSLLQERRRAQHARIVEAIERLYPDRLAEHIEPLAYHAVRGEAWEKAVTYLRQAGVKAAARSAFRQAAAAYEQALGVLPRLPESRFALEHAVDLRTDLRDVLTPLAEPERLLPELLAAVPIAERLQDRWRQVHVSSGLVNTLFGLSDYRRSVTEGIRALALADGLEDAVLRAQLGYRLGASYHLLGDFPRAIAILRDAVTLSAGEHLYARPGAATLPSVIARVWLALSQAETGSFAESLAMADEAMQIATAADHPFSLSFACWALGQVSLRRGDLERATSALAQGREIGRVWGIGLLFLTCGAALGYARALLGHDAEAQRLIDEAGASRASRGLRWLQSLRDGWYAEAHLLADRVDEARGLAHDALRMAEAHEEIGCRAWVLRLLGDIAARGGPPGVEEAGAHFRQALTLAGSLGMRPLVAHCHLGLGSSTGARARREGRRSTSPPRRRCTARWTCASGSRKASRKRRLRTDALSSMRPREPRRNQVLAGECGRSLAVRSAACGAANRPRTSCGECGGPFTQAAMPPKFAAPEVYTPKHLAKRILTSKSALEGERKQVTVLFCFYLKGCIIAAADEKRLLQAAAVIGKDVPSAILQAIAEVPEHILRQTLATLQASECLHETRGEFEWLRVRGERRAFWHLAARTRAGRDVSPAALPRSWRRRSSSSASSPRRRASPRRHRPRAPRLAHAG